MVFNSPRLASTSATKARGTPSARSSIRGGTDRATGQGFRPLLLVLLSTGLLFGTIGTRLAYLQIVQHEENRQLAEKNRIRLIPHPPERGLIRDRNGVLMAGTQLAHSVFLWPLAQPYQDWQSTIQQLAAHLQIPASDIRARLDRAGYQSSFPVRILRNATPEVVTRLQEHIHELPGTMVQPEAVRYYPHGSLAAHLLGYTGEITAEELEAVPPKSDYRLGDAIGQLGVERSYEDRLRGTWGGQQVEVDAAGRVLKILGEKPSLTGQTLNLSLDLQLQQVAEEGLAERKGAVVALDPRNGAVRVMASYPNFDPNMFSSSVSPELWQELQTQQFPFLNRAMRAYPPASTFKIVTATAALESGAFTPDATLQTAPFIAVGGWRFWDWNRAGFGVLGFRQAIAYSSDTFFYQTALRMGADPLQYWAREYGFGSVTGIPLLGEAAGLIPDSEWKQGNLEEGWYAGDTVNMSIGQGFTLSTPLQIAVMTAAVANGGWRVTPQLLANPSEPPKREWIELAPETLEVLQGGLREVITGGTGRGVALSVGLPEIAGKSGTAEDPPRRSHAWFTAYGPFDDPEIVVVAFLENHGGGGSSQAGPIVRQVLEAYFTQQQETVARTSP